MRFFAGILLGLCLFSTGWLGALLLQAGRPTLSSQWIADAYRLKTATAAVITGPKIVIVAGSSALFGLDAGMIEQAYGLPTINFGVNAGLLLPYILYKSKEILHPGDIVLMPLEYGLYNYDGVPNVQMIDQIWSRDPGVLRHLSALEALRMVWMVSAERLVEGFLAQGGAPAMCGPYGYQNIDARGNQIHTSAAEALAWSRDWTNLQKELPRRYAANSHNSDAWAWLKRYFDWARERGIRVIITPPTMMFSPFYYENAQERAFYEGLKSRVEALGVPFVGDPYDYMYERQWYFNTDYHLNDLGRQRHTQRLIADLGSSLADVLSHESGTGRRTDNLKNKDDSE